MARLSPGLAVTGELGSAPLPTAALELIGEYRRTSTTPVAAGEALVGLTAETAGESTLGSQPVLREPGQGGAASSAADLAPQPWAPVALPGADARRTRSRRTSARRRGGIAPAGPATRRAVLAVASVAAAAGLIAAGWAVGTSIADSTRNRPAALGPIIQPPPGGLGGPPPAVANAQPGVPNVAVSQPYGDSNTVFIVRGANWPVGKPVTVTLVGVGASPDHPIADDAGTFNYAINQDHEFFPGGLPVGTYTVRITAAGGHSAEARFLVQRR